MESMDWAWADENLDDRCKRSEHPSDVIVLTLTEMLDRLMAREYFNTENYMEHIKAA